VQVRSSKFFHSSELANVPSSVLNIEKMLRKETRINSGMEIVIFSLCLTRAEERRLEAEEANDDQRPDQVRR
jgi:hypothetical protein